MRRSFLRGVFVLLLAVPAIFAQEPKHFQPGFNLFSKEQDIQLGQENAAQVRKQMPMVTDPFLRDSGFPFTFEVVADPSINAFALPGGPMFINTGLLKAVDNEARLAGVMGHEMSHVILRHGTNQASKAEFIQLPAVLAAQMTGSSMAGKLAQMGIGLGANSVLLKFSRTDESQADITGSHIMAEAGYNPIEMARFFEKLSAKGGQGVPQFFSDHPNPDNRQQAIEQEVRALPKQNYGYETGQFQRMKEVVSKIHEPAPKKPVQ